LWILQEDREQGEGRKGIQTRRGRCERLEARVVHVLVLDGVGDVVSQAELDHLDLESEVLAADVERGRGRRRARSASCAARKSSSSDTHL